MKHSKTHENLMKPIITQKKLRKTQYKSAQPNQMQSNRFDQHAELKTR